MAHTRTHYSDAYYLAQLLERLQHLETELGRKIGAQAHLTQRCQGLLKDLHHLLSQSDSTAEDILEYSLIPKINRLLMDARQQLKLKTHIKKAGITLSKAKRREQIIQERLNGPPPQPYPDAYQPIPRPIHDEERKALIEDALSKLKMLLSEP